MTFYIWCKSSIKNRMPELKLSVRVDNFNMNKFQYVDSPQNTNHDKKESLDMNLRPIGVS